VQGSLNGVCKQKFQTETVEKFCVIRMSSWKIRSLDNHTIGSMDGVGCGVMFEICGF
jgi:hypothetical protein